MMHLTFYSQNDIVYFTKALIDIFVFKIRTVAIFGLNDVKHLPTQPFILFHRLILYAAKRSLNDLINFVTIRV